MSYTAYEKNELKITLTPQTSAQRPGVVNILARFQVMGSVPVQGLAFQAAVPKVSERLSYSSYIVVVVVVVLSLSLLLFDPREPY